MVKIALLGTLSSHTETYCKCAAACEDAEIIGIFGEDAQRNQYLCQTYGLQEKPIDQLLQECGLSAEQIAQRVKDALEAKKNG